MTSERVAMTINNVDFKVTVEGGGRPVLLLHGWPDCAKLWRGVSPILAERGYRSIAPDLRGFGETEAPRRTQDYKIELLADDCLGILDALGVDQPVDVIGHDWGAALGWILALHHEERVNSLVALSVGHPNAFTRAGLGQLAHSWYMLVFELRYLAEWLFSFNDFWLTRKVASYEPETEKWVRDLSRPGRLTAGMNWYRANVLSGTFKNWGRCRRPVLGIWSDEDHACRDKQMRGSAKYMDAPWRYECLEGVGHWIPLERPVETANLALEWFDSWSEMSPRASEKTAPISRAAPED